MAHFHLGTDPGAVGERPSLQTTAALPFAALVHVLRVLEYHLIPKPCANSALSLPKTQAALPTKLRACYDSKVLLPYRWLSQSKVAKTQLTSHQPCGTNYTQRYLTHTDKQIHTFLMAEQSCCLAPTPPYPIPAEQLQLPPFFQGTHCFLDTLESAFSDSRLAQQGW